MHLRPEIVPDPRRMAIRTGADVTSWRWALTLLAIPRLVGLYDLAGGERAHLVYRDLATMLPGTGQRALLHAAIRWNRKATGGLATDPW